MTAVKRNAKQPVRGEPRFSIILPTHHRPTLLRRALESVLRQGFRDFDVWVVDDGPDPATAAVAKSFGSPRLHYLPHDTNGGVSAARNSGIAASRGAWVVFLDDDDELLPHALARLHRFLEASPPDLAFTWGGIEKFRDGEMIGEVTWPPIPEPLAHLGAGSGYALTVRRDVLARIRGFDETLGSGVDFDLLIRLGRGCMGRPVPEVLVRVHLHQGEQLTDSTARKAHDFLQIAGTHRAFLSSYPRETRAFLLKTVRLSFRHGLRREGRRILLRMLQSEPLRWRTWKSWLLLEVLGSDVCRDGRRGSRMGSRR